MVYPGIFGGIPGAIVLCDENFRNYLVDFRRLKRLDMRAKSIWH